MRDRGRDMSGTHIGGNARTTRTARWHAWPWAMGHGLVMRRDMREAVHSRERAVYNQEIRPSRGMTEQLDRGTTVTRCQPL